MPASKAASVQARVWSNSTPPEKVSHEPREISETSRSEEPSLRYLMTGSLRRPVVRLRKPLDLREHPALHDEMRDLHEGEVEGPREATLRLAAGDEARARGRHGLH